MEGGRALLTQTTETPYIWKHEWVGAVYGWVWCCLIQNDLEVPPLLD